MNKRINELMDQSVETRIDIFSNEEYNAFSREKFAKLIILECANLTLDYKNADYYQGWLDYRNEIKKHFGLDYE